MPFLCILQSTFPRSCTLKDRRDLHSVCCVQLPSAKFSCCHIHQWPGADEFGSRPHSAPARLIKNPPVPSPTPPTAPEAGSAVIVKDVVEPKAWLGGGLPTTWQMGRFVILIPSVKGIFQTWTWIGRSPLYHERQESVRQACLRRTRSQEWVASLNVVLSQEPLRELSLGNEGHTGRLSVMKKPKRMKWRSVLRRVRRLSWIMSQCRSSFKNEWVNE